MAIRYRPSPLFIGILTLITVPFVLWLAFNLMWAYAWRDMTPRGPLPAAADWPEPVRQLRAALAQSDVDVESFAVYLLYGQPGNLLSTVACRMDDSAGALDLLTARLRLQQIDRDEVAGSLGREILACASSEWWPSEDDQAAEYFGSENLIAGEKDDQYVVARDRSRGLIFIHYYFNF